jgi:hypothetical protein
MSREQKALARRMAKLKAALEAEIARQDASAAGREGDRPSRRMARPGRSEPAGDSVRPEP